MKALVTPPKKTIDRERLVFLARAVWYLNDIQLNYWNELKNFLDRVNAKRHENKYLINKILENLRNNTFANIWKDCEKIAGKEDVYEESGKCQDRMEWIMEQAFDVVTGLHNRFVCFFTTPFGKGDTCWLHSDDKGYIQIKILGCRMLYEDDITDGEKTEKVIKVIALNKDGKEYGEPFWVRDDHIAKHKKEFTNN